MSWGKPLGHSEETKGKLDQHLHQPALPAISAETKWGLNLTAFILPVRSLNPVLPKETLWLYFSAEE